MQYYRPAELNGFSGERAFSNKTVEYPEGPSGGFGVYLQETIHPSYEKPQIQQQQHHQQQQHQIHQQAQQQQLYHYTKNPYQVVDEQHPQAAGGQQSSYFPYTHMLQPYMWMPAYQPVQGYQQPGYVAFSPSHQQSIQHNHQQQQQSPLLQQQVFYHDHNQYYNANPAYLQGNEGLNSIIKKEGITDMSPLAPQFSPPPLSQLYNKNYIAHPHVSKGEIQPQLLSDDSRSNSMQSRSKYIHSSIQRADGIYGINLDDDQREKLLKFLVNRRALVNAKYDDDEASEKARDTSSKSKNLWSEDVSAALDYAITSIPKDEYNRIRLSSKQFGRNELISMYIYFVTGEKRKIKQISSHLQVWKKRLIRDLSKITDIMKTKKLGKFNKSKPEIKTAFNDKLKPNENSDRECSNVAEIDSEDTRSSSEEEAKRRSSRKLINDFNSKLFLSKNGLETNEEIIHYYDMTILVFNLLEYGIVKSEFTMSRFREVFHEVSEKLSRELIDST
ncbi:hypothetical protein QEN19_002526 [Hanseniaspora menglaensis]